MEKEVVITYETLFEILRREKAREELQELPENFNEEVRKYLSEKKQTMLSLSDDQFSELEQEKTQKQILNIKKILNELYERREKKVINIALSKSRIPKSVLDISNFTEIEKGLYNKLILTFNESRQHALKEILLENVSSPKEERKMPVEKKQDTVLEQANEEEQKKEEAEGLKTEDVKKIRFLCDVSQFVGPNLEIYGPFKTEELAVLPSAVCGVLINKEKAEFAEK